MERIPLLVPRMPTTDRLLRYLRQIDEKRTYSNFGPLSAEFERRIITDVAPNMSVKNITAVSNCTIGLELMLQALRLRPQARVLVPSISFVATATSIRRIGMIPVFTDVDPSSWCLTPEIAEKASQSSLIDAVMPVATFGRSQDTERWDHFSRRTGIPVVIDAAGAFGNQAIGTSTDVVFSFHATKAFGVGEGGAVLSSNDERIEQVRMLSNFGLNTNNGELRQIGTNGKMSEYHSAVGLASFDEWNETKRDRIALHTRYLARLQARCPTLSYQDRAPDGIYAVLPVLVPEHMHAESIIHRLGGAGIETRRWHCPPLHQHAALADCPTTGLLSVAEDICSRLVGLPFFLDLLDTQIDFICDCVSEALTPSS